MLAEFSDKEKGEYSRAYDLYIKGELEAAMTISTELEQSGARSLRIILLQACIYRDQGKYNELIATLKRIVAHVNDSLGQSQLSIITEAYSMLGSAYHELGEASLARTEFLKSASKEQRQEQERIEVSNAIFASNHELLPPWLWDELFERYQESVKELPRYDRHFYNHVKIRLAYISADFRQHAVAWFVYPLLRYFNSEKFDVYIYAGNEPDNITTALQELPHIIWRDISQLDMPTIARTINDDEIDILFDLAGHTANNYLPVLAQRPATMQLSGIGYMGSTGLVEVDYFLGDEFLDGIEGEDTGDDFTEEILALKHSHFCYGLLQPLPEVSEKPPCCTKGYITFASFNNFSKVTAEILSLWSEILRRTPNSRLLLKHRLLNSETGREIVKERLIKAGIDPERVDMRGFSRDYLEEYNDVDIGLDTYPYTGGLTTCEALYMGVPVITRYGITHGSRFGYSLLANIGIAELAVNRADKYIELACDLANDVDTLIAMRQGLRNMMHNSRLMDMEHYTREVENVLIKGYDKLRLASLASLADSVG